MFLKKNLFRLQFTHTDRFYCMPNGVGNQKLLSLMTADVIETSVNLPPMSLRSRVIYDWRY
jgi:hypothetical protein